MTGLIKCPECGKQYMGQKKLQAHMEKVHAVAPEGGTSNPPSELVDAVQPETTPKDMVVIRSADTRQLEVAIGPHIFKGNSITVPKDMEGEIRRILETGGFYIKD